jgi:hypothetical protein
MLFLKATLTILEPQNRIVKAVNREYLNILSCLAICEIKVWAKRCICHQMPVLSAADDVRRVKHTIIPLEVGHANLYNGIPLSLNAKPQ